MKSVDEETDQGAKEDKILEEEEVKASDQDDDEYADEQKKLENQSPADSSVAEDIAPKSQNKQPEQDAENEDDEAEVKPSEGSKKEDEEEEAEAEGEKSGTGMTMTHEIGEEEMLDIAESIFNMIAQCLMQHDLTVRKTFGGDDIIYVLPEFEGEPNVEVMTADDFITRCYEIGVQ